MARKRRVFGGKFKAKVALAAIRGDKTLSQLASQFSVTGNQVSAWKRKLLSHSPETKSLFSNLAELSMIRDLTQGGDHGRLFGESGTSDDAAVSIVG